MPYPQAKPTDPVHLKTFDPLNFYPALAVQDGLTVGAEDASSINASSSLGSQRYLFHSEEKPSEAWLLQQRRKARMRICIIATVVFVAVAMIDFVFAWLGAHNFF